MTLKNNKSALLAGLIRKTALGLGVMAIALFAACNGNPAAYSATKPPPSPTVTPPGAASPSPSAAKSPAIAQDTPAPTPEPTPVKAADLPRDEDGLVIDSAQFGQPIELMVTADYVNLRHLPDIEKGQRVTLVTMGQRIQATAAVDGWFLVTTVPGKQQGYIRSDYAEDYDPARVFYARPKKKLVITTEKDGSETTQTDNLVDVREYVPDAVYNMVFATPDNYTGKTLYSRDACLLQKGTAQKLAQAQELFKADGYRLKIYDAYRPSTVSGELYKVFPNSIYVAPAGSSMHNRGAAVDITLVDANGDELEMPSAVMELNEKAGRNYSGTSAQAKANLDYLTGIMTKCGFVTYNYEWWHYTDSKAGNYPVTDHDISKLPYEESIR